MLHIDYVFALFTVSVALAAYIGQVQMTIRERIGDLKRATLERRRLAYRNRNQIITLKNDIKENRSDASLLLIADVLFIITGLLLLASGLRILALGQSGDSSTLRWIDLQWLDRSAIVAFVVSILYLIGLHGRQWWRHLGKRKRKVKPNEKSRRLLQSE